MFEIVPSFCVQFYKCGSNKVLYRLALLPPKITQPDQTFQIGKKNETFVKDAFKDSTRSSEKRKLPSGASIITNFEHIRRKKQVKNVASQLKSIYIKKEKR